MTTVTINLVKYGADALAPLPATASYLYSLAEVRAGNPASPGYMQIEVEGLEIHMLDRHAETLARAILRAIEGRRIAADNRPTVSDLTEVA